MQIAYYLAVLGVGIFEFLQTFDHKSFPGVGNLHVGLHAANSKDIILQTSTPFQSHALKSNKLPLKTKPVTHDNNTIFSLKPGDQTSMPVE